MVREAGEPSAGDPGSDRGEGADVMKRTRNADFPSSIAAASASAAISFFVKSTHAATPSVLWETSRHSRAKPKDSASSASFAS